MDSTAGRRIVKRTGASDSLAKGTEGNSLLRNGPTRWENLCDQGAFAPVARAGWSWGGQFLDVNNDTHLDLYALAGYYTPPGKTSEHDF